MKKFVASLIRAGLIFNFGIYATFADTAQDSVPLCIVEKLIINDVVFISTAAKKANTTRRTSYGFRGSQYNQQHFHERKECRLQ